VSIVDNFAICQTWEAIKWKEEWWWVAKKYYLSDIQN
jgi:hypothetical protein